jgi:hypothetical protein
MPDLRAWEIFQAFMTTDEGRQHPERLYPDLHALGEQFRMPDGTTIVVSRAGVSRGAIGRLMRARRPSRIARFTRSARMSARS